MLVKGSRGTRTDIVADAIEGGVGLMLYHLLYPLHSPFSVLQRHALHHVPHRGREPDGAGAQSLRSGRG